ncbi:hypothetical protein E1301_Tti020987 [Triplophysa tibetana]|uniref:Uncharacterized protein n=1 Tax=Triplophysa tibetana TaxID=1572043 RepID=A0A5A9NB16_9TELE|nr:hypothetical protein E1301_Tti020987 [Triplophysa tibetana]
MWRPRCPDGRLASEMQEDLWRPVIAQDGSYTHRGHSAAAAAESTSLTFFQISRLNHCTSVKRYSYQK